MFTTSRAILALALSLLLLQLVDAYGHGSYDHSQYKRYSEDSDRPIRYRDSRSDVRHGGLHFPDTNAGKTINRGDRVQNKACKKWYPIRDYILQNVFKGICISSCHSANTSDRIDVGQCGNEARAAVRLAFHDAATFSLARQRAGKTNGGADGSMLSDPSEVRRIENNGLQEIVAILKPLPKKFGVSNGDLLHVTGILAVVFCPGMCQPST